MGVKLQVDVDVKGKENVTRVFGQIKGAARSLSNDITAVATSFLAIERGIRLLGNVVMPVIKSADEAERSQNRLGISLEIAGKNTEKARKSIADFAAEMQRASGVSDELITDVTASNVMMGMSVEQSEALTQASLGLAKARGIDLQSANRMLIQSLRGEGRELKLLVPEISGFTKEQLRAGAAINLVNDRMNKFISADANTTGGVWDRIKSQFGEAFEGAGKSLFEGMNLSGRFPEIEQSIQSLGAFFDRFKPQLIEMGHVLGGTLVDSIKTLAKELEALGPSLGTLTTQFVGLIKVGLIPFIKMGNAAASIALLLKGDTEGYERLYKMNTEVLAPMFDKSMDEAFGTNYSEPPAAKSGPGSDMGSKQRAATQTDKDRLRSWGLGGFMSPTVVAPPSEAKYPAGAGVGALRQMDEATPKGSLADQLAPGKRKPGKFDIVPQDAQDAAQAAQAKRALMDQLAAIEGDGQNKIIQAHNAGIRKINEFEKAAADKGIDVHAEANAVRQAMAEQLDEKLSEMYLDESINAAKAAGQTTRVIELEYEKQVQALDKKFDQGLIDEQQYLDQVAEMRRKADNDERQTSGSASDDETMSQAAGFVSSISGGVNSIIQQVGSMFGPTGQFIAGIISFFNQTPEQFAQMIDGLIEGFKNLPKFIIENIGTLVERIPEMLAAQVEVLYDVSFWTRVVKGLWTAVTNMFKNFWALLFGGQLQHSVDGAKKDSKLVSFGNDDPNAGDGEFKIKDAQLSGQRRAAARFEDSFGDTVDTAAKGFTEYLKEGIQGMLDGIAAFFANVVAGVWNTIQSWGEKFKDWGAKIWHGLVEGISNGWDWIKGMGYQIWNGITSAVAGAGNSLANWGAAITDGLISRIKAWPNSISNVGAQMFDGLIDRIKSWPSTLANVGKQMANGLLDGLYGAWDWLSDFFGSLIPGGGGDGKAFYERWNSGGIAGSQMGSNRAVARAMLAAGALAFASGGTVPGTGFSDSVPAVLTPGEVVLNRAQVAALGSGAGGQTINITFNVAAGAKFDREAVREAMPVVIEHLRRESRNGTLVVHNSGVFG